MSANPSESAHGDDSTNPVIYQCWSCQGPLGLSLAFCPTCDAIQPPGRTEHFAQLDVRPTFDIDLAELERKYFGLQRAFHPDHFATKSAQEQEYSLRHATNLNDAFKVLKSPVLRAEYLLELKGAPPAGGHEKTVNDEDVLMEAMETREALADAETPADVDAILARADAGIRECTEALSAAFGNSDLVAAAALTLRLTYLHKLDDEAAQRARILARAS